MGHKLGRIFNERFLVDIVNIWTIAKRYYRWNLLWVGVCSVVIAWVYLTQSKVHHRELRFFPMEKSDAAAQAIMPEVPFMKPAKSDELDVREIWRITSSRSFIQDVYDQVVADNKLSKLAFYDHGNRVSYDRIIAKCSFEKTCIRNEAIEILGGMFAVKKNVDIPGFTLKTYSFNAKDSEYLEKILVERIKKTRQQHLMAEVELKIRLASDAYARKRESTNFDSYEEKNGSLRMVEAKIVDLDARIKAMQASRDIEQGKMLSLSLQFQEATRDEQYAVNSKTRKKSERVRTLETEVAGLRENIELLKLNPSNATVVAQLEERLRKASAELTRIGKSAPTRTLSSIQKAKGEEIPDLAVGATVARKNVVKLESEIATLEGERDGMVREAGSLKRELQEITPDIEMLLSLESRLKTLKIEKVTTTADLIFDDIPQVVESLMRHSTRKVFFIFVFSVAIGCLILTLLLYLFDDRIHDAEELLAVAPDLKVVGKAANLDI